MKLSGVGLEPHECNDEILIKRLGLNKALLTLVGVIVGLIALSGLILFLYQLIKYDFENALPFLVIIPAFSLFFVLPGIFVFREVKAIQKELSKRGEGNENTAFKIETKTKQNTRRSLIAIICVVVIAIIVIFKVVGDSVYAPRCIECGEKGIYSQYGYCYSCYKDVYNNIKENGK